MARTNSSGDSLGDMRDSTIGRHGFLKDLKHKNKNKNKKNTKRNKSDSNKSTVNDTGGLNVTINVDELRGQAVTDPFKDSSGKKHDILLENLDYSKNTSYILPPSGDEAMECMDLDDYDDNGINGESTNKRRVNGRDHKRKYKDLTSDEESMSDLIMLSGAEDDAPSELDNMHVEDIGERVIGWIEVLECMRRKSLNLNGKISGNMKKLFERLKYAVSLLITRSEAKGDPLYLAQRNKELNVLLKVERLKYKKLKAQNDILDDRSKCRSNKSYDYAGAKYTKSGTANIDESRWSGGVSTSNGDSVNKNKNRSKYLHVGEYKAKFEPYKKRRNLTLNNKYRGEVNDDIHTNVDSDVLRRSRNMKSDTRYRYGYDRRVESYPEPVSREKSKIRADSDKVSKAVVTIKCREGMSYADVLKKARDEITLSRDMDMAEHCVRQAYTDGYLIEVSGEDCESKADRLARYMNEMFNDSGVMISRPRGKMIDIKIHGFDVSITSNELVKFVANAGECTTAELSMINYRFTRNNIGIAWMKCPINVANRLHNIGSYKIGWSKISIERSKPRPLQCYRCHELGHSKNKCKNPIDRSGSCYNYGENGHKIKECKNATSCYVCRHYGENENHKVGSKYCMASKYKDCVYNSNRRDGKMDDK